MNYVVDDKFLLVMHDFYSSASLWLVELIIMSHLRETPLDGATSLHTRLNFCKRKWLGASWVNDDNEPVG